MARKNLLTENCGDWHLGWGLGGHDKIGKLTLDPLTNSFVWVGYSQGRHGGRWNRGAYIKFTVDSEGDIRNMGQKGGVPVYSELRETAELIISRQLNK